MEIDVPEKWIGHHVVITGTLENGLYFWIKIEMIEDYVVSKDAECKDMKDSRSVPSEDIDRLTPILQEKNIFSSACAVGDYITAECKIHPSETVNDAIKSLVAKAQAGKPLPQFSACRIVGLMHLSLVEHFREKGLDLLSEPAEHQF